FIISEGRDKSVLPIRAAICSRKARAYIADSFAAPIIGEVNGDERFILDSRRRWACRRRWRGTGARCGLNRCVRCAGLCDRRALLLRPALCLLLHLRSRGGCGGWNWVE